MEPEFWHERWEKGEIGFHQHDFNRYMQEFIDRLDLPAGARVLVPLCGKSLDMVWLAGQGYGVTGIEISEVAVRDFFTENAFDYDIEARPGALLYRSEMIEIFCGDFFNLNKADLPQSDAVYDRASLVALPPAMRPAYATRLSGLIDDGTRSLLVTLDYPQEEMRGPPFSVTLAEVKHLFSSNFSIEHLHSEDCLANEPRFRKKGLSRLDEHVFMMQKDVRPSL